MTDGLCSGEIVIANRLPQGAGATMDHQPELVFLVSLDLDEVVATPERGRLDPA